VLDLLRQPTAPTLMLAGVTSDASVAHGPPFREIRRLVLDSKTPTTRFQALTVY